MSVHRSAPPRKPGPDSVRPRWRRWLLRVLLAGLALALVIGLPMVWVLDKQVRAEFDALAWQVPTRVYARPLLLKPGLRLDAATLELELAAAGYRKDGGGDVPGTYLRDGGRFRIGTRSFTDLDGPVPAAKLEVVLAGGKVSSVADRRAGKLDSARIDPARIATLYGGNVQEERRIVQLTDVPPLMVMGLQAVEDRNFKHHHGIDPWGVLRAMWVNVREGELEQGASTLTQQLVRSLFLTPREAHHPQGQGSGVFADYRGALRQAAHSGGVPQPGLPWSAGQPVGARRGCGVGVLVRSRAFQPAHRGHGAAGGHDQGPVAIRAAPQARGRQGAPRPGAVGVAGTRADRAAEAKRAKAAPLGVSAKPGVASNRNPAFMDLVRRQLARDYPADALRGAGLTVLTTLSPSAQLLSEKAVSGTLAQVQRKDGPTLQAGMVVTDAHSGEVLAMVGNRATDQPGFNRALEAQRPVGSLLKPMVYLLALAQPDRWSLATPVDDAPVNVTLPNGKSWHPGNSDGRSHGRVQPGRCAGAVLQPGHGARRHGRGPGSPGRTAEGAGGPARAGQSVADPGLGGPEPVRDGAGLPVPGLRRRDPAAARRARRARSQGQGRQPLRFQRRAGQGRRCHRRAPGHAGAAGRGDARHRRARCCRDGLGPLRVAGKTGTSNDSRDSWFAGYTGDHLAVVWVGNDQNEPTGLYGATGAMRVWSALFTKLPSAPLNVGSAGPGIRLGGRGHVRHHRGKLRGRAPLRLRGRLPAARTRQLR